MTRTEAQTCRMIREMMADIMSDSAWLTLATDAGVYTWIAIDRFAKPTTAIIRAYCEDLIVQSVAPEHCTL